MSIPCCEWCEAPSIAELYADELRDSEKGTELIVRRRFTCKPHLEKTRQLMHLDGFNGWAESQFDEVDGK